MGTYAYYNSHRTNLNNIDASYADIKGYFTGQANPVESTYTPQRVDAVKPTLRSATGLAESLGIDKTFYDGDTILSTLNSATTDAYNKQQQQLSDSTATTQREWDNIQDNRTQLADSVYGQHTQLGIAKHMVATNTLSSILGTSQEFQSQMNAQVDAQINAYNTYQSSLGQNSVKATLKANEGLGKLEDLAETLYNKEILEYNAELQYNKAVEQSYANYLAFKQVADTNYESSLSLLAAQIYNSNQNASAKVSTAAMMATAQDNASAKLVEAGKLQAAAIVGSRAITSGVLSSFDIETDYNKLIDTSQADGYLAYLAGIQTQL